MFFYCFRLRYICTMDCSWVDHLLTAEKMNNPLTNNAIVSTNMNVQKQETQLPTIENVQSQQNVIPTDSQTTFESYNSTQTAVSNQNIVNQVVEPPASHKQHQQL